MNKYILIIAVILLVSCSKKEGCIDDIACNFDSLADIDDSSCEYAEEFYDCDGICLNDIDEDNVCDENEIIGCLDNVACNYDETATDNGSCEYAEENYDCDGECIVLIDCAGVCDGTALIDVCNNCVGGTTGFQENYAMDCAGTCDGTALIDDCNNCVGGVTGLEENYAMDCAGVCDGAALIDDCNNCVDGGTGLEENYAMDCCDVCNGDNSTCYTVVDIDGNEYCTIEIGEQIWMSGNLKTTHYQNGDAITYITNGGGWGSFEEGQYGVYNNDSSNADIYGNLYNWAVVDDDRGVCPIDWHVPASVEYSDLVTFLGTNSASKLTGNASFWNSGSLTSNDDFGTSGFNTLPSGFHNFNSGDYSYIGSGGYFWSSSQDDSHHGLSKVLFYNNSSVSTYDHHKFYGFSVRCVRD